MKTYTEDVTFKGKTYPTREIFLSGYNKEGSDFWYGEYVVSTTSLRKELEKAFDMPIESEEHSHADWIDNGIFFYVPDDMINAGDDILSKYILDNLF
jgi:hypothetical protein